MLKRFALLCLSLATATLALADTTVMMHMTAKEGIGNSVGSIVVSETKYGLLFTPKLQGLTPGVHGFHIHENLSCSQDGMAAGGHFDPAKTGKHLGPYHDEGHLGDLPIIYVAPDGSVSLPVLAPRLKHFADIQHHALMLHDGGDNYSDVPNKLGGGGARMVCGLIN